MERHLHTCARRAILGVCVCDCDCGRLAQSRTYSTVSTRNPPSEFIPPLRQSAHTLLPLDLPFSHSLFIPFPNHKRTPQPSMFSASSSSKVVSPFLHRGIALVIAWRRIVFLRPFFCTSSALPHNPGLSKLHISLLHVRIHVLNNDTIFCGQRMNAESS